MIEQKISEYVTLVDNELNRLLDFGQREYGEVIEAMRYSINAGGKRIRAILVLEFAKICGADLKKALRLACAIEMVHTYSLIHDDLPCMDNDDFRRGQPSCHIKYGEATALLAGDALLTLAFNVIANTQIPAELKVEAIKELSQNAGVHGMIGGQVLDLKYEGKKIDVNCIERIHALKTSALIKTACRLGLICGGSLDKFAVCDKYSENIGLAFQIVDDILDITSTQEVLGKPINSDSENQKTTYVTVYGVEKCREIVDEITQNAINSLAEWGSDADFLIEFALKLANRVK